MPRPLKHEDFFPVGVAVLPELAVGVVPDLDNG